VGLARDSRAANIGTATNNTMGYGKKVECKLTALQLGERGLRYERVEGKDDWRGKWCVTQALKGQF